MSDLATEIEQRREQLVEVLRQSVRRSAPDSSQGEEEQERQFYHAFLHVVVAATRGDSRPKIDFLEALIPGVKGFGVSLGVTLASGAAMMVTMATEISREHLPWYARFCYEYTQDIIRIWESAE